jgi:cytochrome c553
MGKKKVASFLYGAMNVLKIFFQFFIKMIYIGPFFVFGLWLISVVYFPGFDLNASISLLKYRNAKTAVQANVQKKEAIPRGHFHMIDGYVERGESQPSICATCHGIYAHSKEKTVRALLNMHEGFIDCSVCHVRRDKADGTEKTISKNGKIEFLWVERETGQFKTAVEGEYGKYPAKIFSVIYTEQGTRRIYSPMTEEAAQDFLEIKAGLTEKQLKDARAKLHNAISKEPASCSECHKKDGYLNFEKIGFPKQRVDHLVSSEFVGMIDKYKTFYLPSGIDFRGN